MRTAEGSVRIDPTGKQAGRGAYLCVDPACWSAPGLAQRLGHALKTTVSDEDYEALVRYGAELPTIAHDAE